MFWVAQHMWVCWSLVLSICGLGSPKMFRCTTSKDENVPQQPLCCPITFFTLKRQRPKIQKSQKSIKFAITLPQGAQFTLRKDRNVLQRSFCCLAACWTFKRQSQGDDNPQGRIQKYELGGHEGVGSRPLPYAPPPLPVP